MPTFEVEIRGTRPLRVPAPDVEHALDRAARRALIRDCPQLAGILPRRRFCELAGGLLRRVGATAIEAGR
jgi:hypothetical protein